MAPNRRQIAAALDPLEDNTPLVQAKYLPVTNTTSSSSSTTVPAPQATVVRSDTSATVADAYWNWSSEKKIKVEKDLFSACHFEQNAIRDYQRRQQEASSKQTTIVRSSTPAPVASYWEERVEALLTSVRTIRSDAHARVTDYWDWPEETRVNALQVAWILQDEWARHQVSAATVEQRLVQDAATRKNVRDQTNVEHDEYWEWETPSTVHAEPSNVNESYWQWETPMVSKATQKQHVMASILEYEAIRPLFSGDHTWKVQVDAAATKTSSSIAVEAAPLAAAASDSYWTWPAEENDYWNMRPLPYATVLAAPQGYWDM